MAPARESLGEDINQPWESQLLYSTLFQSSVWNLPSSFFSPLFLLLHHSIIPSSSLPLSLQPNPVTSDHWNCFPAGSHFCVRKLWEQRDGHPGPYTADGHPRNASSPWVWATANHVASQCHRGTETKKDGALFEFLFPPSKKQEASVCSYICSTRRGFLILHSWILSHAF